ncbi:N-acetyltransferase [Planctomycetales bacterium 10988]|nr:N-acetyltransferase [Planctomycetales bacterium 10988]
MSPSITIRRQLPEDLPALRIIYLQTRQETFTWLNTSKFQLSDFDRDTEGEVIWVALQDGKAVGFLGCWEPENFIHHLYVLRKARKEGIGKALLSTCLKSLIGPVQLKCSKENHHAFQFYQHLGWQVIGENTNEEGAYYLMEFRTSNLLK